MLCVGDEEMSLGPICDCECGAGLRPSVAVLLSVGVFEVLASGGPGSSWIGAIIALFFYLVDLLKLSAIRFALRVPVWLMLLMPACEAVSSSKLSFS